MKKVALILSTVLLASLVSGCVRGGAYEPKNTHKFNQEDTARFVLFDSRAQRSVTCPEVQMGRTADGRMKVAAKLRNRENRRIEVQANCEFKDAQGFTVDSTPFRTVILDENAMETVTFESFSKDAARYTVRVRQAR
jgi:uncharacterized protein YcfL